MRNSPIAKLRLWYTQTVLPLIYDYSLSLYELICKMADSLNKTIEAVDELDDKVDGIQEQINEMGIPQIDDRLDGIDQNLTNLTNDIDTINNTINNLGDDVGNNTYDIQWLKNKVIDHENRISILEGYAFEGITPATKAYVDDHDELLKQYIVNNYISEVQDEIDAIIGGGYTPVYGSVDFGKGTLLRYDPTIDDPSNPDKMVVVSDDFQVSAVFVQALNLVYGAIFISADEGATIDCKPADTYVLCWKNSEDLPPIAHDYPGIKVQWGQEDVVPDIVKIGMCYNNKFTKRCDCFLTPRRDQYPEVLGSGYKWYSEVYFDNIEVGDPVVQWNIAQIPFCYLSLASSGYTETNLYDLENNTRGSSDGYLDTATKLLAVDTTSPANCHGWGIEFNFHDITAFTSSTTAPRGTVFSAAWDTKPGNILFRYDTNRSINLIRVVDSEGTPHDFTNKISLQTTMKLIMNYDDHTLTLYDALGDVVAQETNVVYDVPENKYQTDAVLYGYINDLGSKSQKCSGTIDKFRFFVLN